MRTTTTAAPPHMARYDAARCQSVKELVAAYGGKCSAQATTDDSEWTSALSGTDRSGGLGVGIRPKLKGWVRLIAGECRRIWESVSL